MKLSIIIPAYNAQNYIDTCLNSCFAQDLAISDYEVIIVNDGSTDDTEKKITVFADTYPNLHLIHQDNKGHGASRNTGVALAKGNYIYFLDADDYIAKNTLGTLIKLLEQHNLDILGFSSKNISDDNHQNSKDSGKELSLNPIVTGIDYLGTQHYRPEVWWYMTKRAFYLKSEAFFYDRKFVQDAFLTPTLISKAERIMRIRYDVHRYRISNSSVTRNKSDKQVKIHLDDLCFATQKLYDLRQDLIQQGGTNTQALHSIHKNQQRYAFIIITRFIRSNLKSSKLKPILLQLKTIEGYPLHLYMSTLSYKDPLKVILTSIFNTKLVLYLSLYLFRFGRRITTLGR